MIILAIIVIVILLGIFGAKTENSHSYRAAFGNPSSYISSANHGFAVTGDKGLTKKESCCNAICFGPTGSGKSSVIIFNSLRFLSRGRSSIVVYDISGELQQAIPYLQKRGYKVLRFDPS